MGKRIICVFIVLYFSAAAFSQLKLEVEITGLRNDKGNLMLQLFDQNEKVLKQDMTPIDKGRCSFVFEGLAPGKYAVRYYHDENLNGKMDTNLVGKPVEGYGFSNNVIGKFGPPPFVKWLFELDGNKKIVLKATY
jgi:uncharacterized protein (DUF2141 family)